MSAAPFANNELPTRTILSFSLNYYWDPASLEWEAGAQPFPLDSSLSELALQFDGSANPILYLGAAQPGTSVAAASWQIKKIDVTSGVSIKFADGNANFDNVWNNRASLSYS